MVIIKDLGLKPSGTRNRRFYLVECPCCKQTFECRSDSKILCDKVCRVCKGMKKVSKEKVKTTLDFTVKANFVHNKKYEYNKAEFIKAATKTTVTCPMHGDFLVTPNNHLRGKGCPECARIKKGWSKKVYENKVTILYLLRVNHTLYKIGITSKSIKERYYKDTRDGNILEVLQEHHFFNGVDAFNIEKEVLSKTKSIKYKGPPVLTHGGNSELLLEDCSDLIITAIRNLYEIN